MIRDITLGQYFVSNSLVHRLDARAKILLLIYVIVLIFVTQNVVSLLVVTLFSGLIMLLSGIPVKMYLKNIKVIIPIVIFTAILNIFYAKNGILLAEFWSIKIYSGGLLRALYIFWKQVQCPMYACKDFLYVHGRLSINFLIVFVEMLRISSIFLFRLSFSIVLTVPSDFLTSIILPDFSVGFLERF